MMKDIRIAAIERVRTRRKRTMKVRMTGLGPSRLVAIVLSLAVVAIPAVGSAQEPDLRYRIALKRSATSGYRFFNATQGAPVSIDVNGDNLPDLVVELAGITLRIARTPASSTPTDVLRGIQVELLLPVPNQSGRVAAFGYDVIGSTAPRTFEADLTLGPAARQAGLVVRPTDPGTKLALLGTYATGAFTDAPGKWTNKVRGRLAYQPVPTQMSFGFEQPTSDQTVITANTTTATSVAADVTLSATTGSTNRKVTASLSNLPSVVRVEAQTASGELTRIGYRASAAIRNLTGFFEQSSGTTDSLRQGRVQITNLPAGVDITKAGTSTALETVGNPIGAITVGFARKQAIGTLPSADTSFPAKLTHTTSSTGADKTTLRLVGLRRALVDVSDPTRVELTTSSVPFRAIVKRGTIDVDAQIHKLPSSIVASYSAAGKRISYEGSAPIASMVVKVRHATGWVRNARDLTVTAQNVPRRLNATWAGTSDASRVDVAFDAGGDAIGKVDAIITNSQGEPWRQEDAFQTTNDNRILILDADPRVYIRVRVLGLRALDLERLVVPLGDNRLIQSAEAAVDVTSSARFQVDAIRERKIAWLISHRQVRVRMSRLAPDTTIEYVQDTLDDDRHTTFDYTAGGGVRPSFELFTYDRKQSWKVDVPSLPTELSACLDTGWSRCSQDLPAGALPPESDLSVTAKEPTEVRVFGCIELGNCKTSWRPKNVVLVDIDSLRRLDVAFTPMEAPEWGDDEEGFIFMDTDPEVDPNGIGIDVKIYDGDGNGIRADVPAGFVADDRYVQGDIDPPANFAVRDDSGSADCPSGTSMYVDIDDYFDVDLDEDLCT